MVNNKFSFDLNDYDYDIFSEKDTEVEDSTLDEDNTDVRDNTMDYIEYNSIVEEVDDSEVKDVYENELEEDNKKIKVSYLSVFYTWFSRMGVVIAVILMAMFITKGEILNFVKYVLLLVVSFFIGYFSMFLYDKYKEKN